MKKIVNQLIIGGLCLGMVSCKKDFIDLVPPAQFTDAVYFAKPSDFKAATQRIYRTSKYPSHLAVSVAGK